MEIIERLKRLPAGGVEYVLVVNYSSSADALKIFAEEIMPALAFSAAVPLRVQMTSSGSSDALA